MARLRQTRRDRGDDAADRVRRTSRRSRRTASYLVDDTLPAAARYNSSMRFQHDPTKRNSAAHRAPSFTACLALRPRLAGEATDAARWKRSPNRAPTMLQPGHGAERKALLDARLRRAGDGNASAQSQDHDACARSTSRYRTDEQMLRLHDARRCVHGMDPGEDTPPSWPSLSISHSPVAMRCSWTDLAVRDVAAARSPLMAILWTVAPWNSAPYSRVDGLQPSSPASPFTCSQAVRPM